MTVLLRPKVEVSCAISARTVTFYATTEKILFQHWLYRCPTSIQNIFLPVWIIAICHKFCKPVSWCNHHIIEEPSLHPKLCVAVLRSWTIRSNAPAWCKNEESLKFSGWTTLHYFGAWTVLMEGASWVVWLWLPPCLPSGIYTHFDIISERIARGPLIFARFFINMRRMVDLITNRWGILHGVG